MNDYEKVIWATIIIILVIVFINYGTFTMAKDSFWFYIIMIPLLFVIYYFVITNFENFRTVCGSVSVFNYYTSGPLFLRILEDGTHFAWNEYVNELSVTEYAWEGKHDIQIIAADDPDVTNPLTTVFFDKTYNVSNHTTILVIINEDGTFYEQINVF